MQKTYIIAEIAQGFEGDPGLCKRFIKLAKDCGADAVKFQIFQAEELCTPDYKYNDLFKSLEIPPSVWEKLIAYAGELGIDFYTDIFGTVTLNWMSKTTAKGYKIHSTDLRNYPLLQALRKVKGTLILSTGGSEEYEVQKALDILGERDIILMSGFQAEPNLYSDVELDKVTYLASRFNLPVGYADHIDAQDALATVLPSMAVLKGATVIEKHLTIERNSLQLEDYISALNPDEFRSMVALVRSVEQFVHAPGRYELSEREQKYRINTKKVSLAAHDLPLGHIIDTEDLVQLRTGQPYAEILDMTELIGKKLTRSVSRHAVITREMIQL